MIWKGILTGVVAVMVGVAGVSLWHQHQTSIAAERSAQQVRCDNADTDLSRWALCNDEAGK